MNHCNTWPCTLLSPAKRLQQVQQAGRGREVYNTAGVPMVQVSEAQGTFTGQR